MRYEPSELFRRAVRRILCVLVATCSGSLFFLIACQKQPTDEQLREQAAQATERAKQGSKEALQDARTAAANAERKVDDIAAGVQQGMKSGDHSAGERLDLNTASQVELALLPGISLRKAKEIQEHRPYASPHQLVTRGVLTDSEYAAIASKVTVH